MNKKFQVKTDATPVWLILWAADLEAARELARHILNWPEGKYPIVTEAP